MASPAQPGVSPSLWVPSFVEKKRRLSSSSKLERPSLDELGGCLEEDNYLKSVDLNHVIKLLEETELSNADEQLEALKKVTKRYEFGIPLNDLAHISKILNLCAAKIQFSSVFTEPTCEVLKLYGLPFYKKKLSDEVNYANDVQESMAHLGYLMEIPCSQVRIQICKCVISFYHGEPQKKEFEVYQPIGVSYKRHMMELSGLAETLVLALTLVENQLPEKLWLIKTLQHLSISEANCKLMMKAEAPTRLCSHLNDVDPSGQLLFRSSEILWNLLEKTSKDEIINQLSNLECVQLSALKIVVQCSGLYTLSAGHFHLFFCIV